MGINGFFCRFYLKNTRSVLTSQKDSGILLINNFYWKVYVMLNKNEWIFSIPAPDNGTLVSGFYNAGPMLADDSETTTDDDSKMQIIADVVEEDFENYKKKLADSGLKITCENELGGNMFAECSPFHLSFFKNRSEIRVIEDKTSTPLDSFGYSAKGNGKTTVYQYGLYYDKENRVTDTAVNCGMLYIIHLSDNSIVLIDGGHILQWNEEAAEALWQFILKITKPAEGEKIRIAAWYCTHAHDDHVNGVNKLLNHHGDRFTLERVMFNMPSHSVKGGGYSQSVYYMKKLIREKYPEAKQLKLHSGQKFTLADAEFEIYYAQEDAVEKENITSFPLRDFNCTSSIMRMMADGKTIMFLGDTNVETEALMARITPREIWKSDFVQVAHHCFNYLDTLYEWINAPIAMLPNSYFGGHTPENTPKLAGVIKHLSGEDNIYYEGEATDGFAVVDGEWKRVSSEPVVGGEYDGSGF